MNHVVCVKWGNKYPSQYANVLYNMVRRHTTVPFEFHCLTDDPAGLDSHINVIKLPTDPWVKTWWSKLWMFAPEMPLKGNILFFDLDVVKLFIDCLCKNLTTKNTPARPTANDKSMRNKFKLDSKSPIISFISNFERSIPASTALAIKATV